MTDKELMQQLKQQHATDKEIVISLVEG